MPQTVTRSENLDLLRCYYQEKQSQPHRARRIRDKIALLNKGLVRDVAHRFARQCPEPYEDLEQIGQIGLLKAIDKFEPSKNAAFSSFAVPYIVGAIRHHLRDHWGAGLKVPRRFVEFHSKVRKTQRVLAVHGRKLEEQKIAENLGCPAKKWQTIVEALDRKPLLDYDDLDESIAAPEIELSEQVDICRYIGTLPNPYRSCLIAHYYGQMEKAAIAHRHNLSLTELEELLNEALYWLRCRMEANG